MFSKGPEEKGNARDSNDFLPVYAVYIGRRFATKIKLHLINASIKVTLRAYVKRPIGLMKRGDWFSSRVLFCVDFYGDVSSGGEKKFNLNCER